MNVFKKEPDFRVTIYCDSEEQKEQISGRLTILKQRYGHRRNCNVLEKILEKEIKLK